MILFLIRDSLELVDLLLLVAKLGKHASKITLVLRALLGASDGLVHARGTTDEDLDVLLAGIGKDSLEKVLSDHALRAGPVLWGVVQRVEGAHAVRVLILEVLPFALEENVLLGNVAENESDLCLVVGVLKDGAGELVHGGDAGTTSDQGDVVVLVLLPGVLGDRTLHVESLSRLHVVKVLGHGTTGVLLDDEVEVANGVFITDGSVGTDDGLLHLGTLVLGDQSSCRCVSNELAVCVLSTNIQAMVRPETLPSSGRWKRSLFVLWLMTSLSISFKLTKPWSPPVKHLEGSAAWLGMLPSSVLEAG